jgi:hypothetical protein
VRTFGMDCLSELLAMVSKEAAFREESPAVLALQQRIADVVRIAFSASTAGVVQLRIRGLKIIDQVLKVSSHRPRAASSRANTFEAVRQDSRSRLPRGHVIGTVSSPNRICPYTSLRCRLLTRTSSRSCERLRHVHCYWDRDRRG